MPVVDQRAEALTECKVVTVLRGNVTSPTDSTARIQNETLAALAAALLA